jgi:hypothetical protein
LGTLAQGGFDNALTQKFPEKEKPQRNFKMAAETVSDYLVGTR